MPEPNPSPGRDVLPSSDLPTHVLVVDDEEMMRAMLARELTRLGFRVTTAGSGEEGVERAQIQVNRR